MNDELLYNSCNCTLRSMNVIQSGGRTCENMHWGMRAD